jgi:hypothetical protein
VEQKKLVPIPIFASTNPNLDVKSVILYYKTAGERIFQQIPMAEHGDNGWAATIGCDVLTTFEPTEIDYYIAVLDNDSQLLGTAGTEAQPFKISIVQILSVAPPALPGEDPPAQCQKECPPWQPDCNAGDCKDYGDLCSADSECCTGMICVSGACEPGEPGDSDAANDKAVKHKVRLFLNAGTGIGFVSGGSYGQDDFSNMIYTKEVSVPNGMAMSKLHVRLGAMFALPSVPKLEIGLTFRAGLPLSPDYSPIAPSVIANASYRLAGGDKPKGFELTALFGLGWMNIMHRIPFDDCANTVSDPDNPNGIVCDPQYPKWWETGDYIQRNGFRKAGFLGVEVGLDMYFWVSKSFGFNLGTIFDIPFPTFAVNLDLQGGIALRF